VDGAAVIAQHAHYIQDPTGALGHGHVQKDLHAAGAVGMHRVGPGLARSKISQGLKPANGREINLREITHTVEMRHTYRVAEGRCSIRVGSLSNGSKSIIALQRAITAAMVVVSYGQTTKGKQQGHGNKDSLQKRGVHRFLLIL
jgi:hypothetical protein